MLHCSRPPFSSHQDPCRSIPARSGCFLCSHEMYWHLTARLPACLQAKKPPKNKDKYNKELRQALKEKKRVGGGRQGGAWRRLFVGLLWNNASMPIRAG